MALAGRVARVAAHGAGWSIALAGLLACGESPTGPPEPTPVLQVVGGGGQAGVAGYLIAEPVAVRLSAGDGTPIPFAPVRASVGAPFAGVTPLTAITDAEGVAWFTWRLGLALGAQEMVVSAPGAPTAEPLGVPATAVSNPMRAIGGGIEVMCGIDDGGRLGCWQPARDPDHPPRFVPDDTAERFTALAISPGIDRPIDGCAVAISGRTWCFGVSPVGAVEGLHELPGAYPAFTRITVGGEVEGVWCALAGDGAAWCWGDNLLGMVGDGGATDRPSPTPVATPVRFSSVVVGPDHVCGIATTASIWCWGANDEAQLGQPPSHGAYLYPVRVPSDLDFGEVAIPRRESSCGVERGSGYPWCWGEKHQLGVSEATVTAIEGEHSVFPLYVEPLAGVVGMGRVDAATVVLRRGTVGAWWGDLSPTRDVTIAAVPQPFIVSLGLGSLAIPHAQGVVCGVPEEADAQLCVRFAAITGYETGDAAGFGMPLP